jgi:hypothetical protein
MFNKNIANRFLYDVGSFASHGKRSLESAALRSLVWKRRDNAHTGLELMVLRQKLFATALFLCFGVLVGFSPLLHNHDVDLSHAHQDCGACQWSNSPTDIATNTSEPSAPPLSQLVPLALYQLPLQNPLFLIANRGPPSSI